MTPQQPIEPLTVAPDDGADVPEVETLDRHGDQARALGTRQGGQPGERRRRDIEVVQGRETLGGGQPTVAAARRTCHAAPEPGGCALRVAQRGELIGCGVESIGREQRRLAAITERQEQREAVQARPVELTERGLGERLGAWCRRGRIGRIGCLHGRGVVRCGTVRFGAEVYAGIVRAAALRCRSCPAA